jgi:hypothetical protein
MACILYRNCYDWEQEKQFAEKYYECFKNRTLIPCDELVIARFSSLPFYKELEDDLSYFKSKLINSYQQHIYISDLEQWYSDLYNYTPKSYFRLEDLPNEGSFVLKGETNSKKQNWNTHMFATSKAEAVTVQGRLLQDGLIGSQKIIAREYVPLVEYAKSIGGLPISKEFRFFCYKEKIICGGFYWENFWDGSFGDKPKIEDVPINFLKKLTKIISQNTNAYVIDVAQTKEGEWILIELNDLQMSGLCGIDPNLFYKNLSLII